MTLADLASRYDGFYTPRFVLRLDGAEYDGSEGVVSRVSVEAAAEKADRFTVTLDGAYDGVAGEFGGVEWDRFETGTDVTVSMGYGGTTETLLVGTVAEHRARFPAGGSPRVEVSGYGLRHELGRDSESRSWDDSTDAEVAEAVADDYRFDVVDVSSTDTRHAKVVQDDETDLAFLERLAGRNGGDDGGFRVTVRRDEFAFGPAPTGGEPTASLAYGDALRSFSAEYRTGSQVGSVEVRGYDPGGKSGVVGTAESGGAGTGTEVLRRPVRSRSEAESAARARLDEIESERLSGRGESIGLPEIRAGETVELTRLGERFSGTYYVETATHRVDPEGYTTAFTVRLPTGVSVG